MLQMRNSLAICAPSSVSYILAMMRMAGLRRLASLMIEMLARSSSVRAMMQCASRIPASSRTLSDCASASRYLHPDAIALSRLSSAVRSEITVICIPRLLSSSKTRKPTWPRPQMMTCSLCIIGQYPGERCVNQDPAPLRQLRPCFSSRFHGHKHSRKSPWFRRLQRCSAAKARSCWG